MVDVDVITCTATTEPNVGSDPRSVETRATHAGEHLDRERREDVDFQRQYRGKRHRQRWQR